MHIKEIYNIEPVCVQDQDANTVYVSHYVVTDNTEDTIVLITRYSDEPISVYPARLLEETQQLVPVSVEESEKIAEHIQSNPISILRQEEAEEAGKTWQNDSMTV